MSHQEGWSVLPVDLVCVHAQHLEQSLDILIVFSLVDVQGDDSCLVRVPIEYSVVNLLGLHLLHKSGLQRIQAVEHLEEDQLFGVASLKVSFADLSQNLRLLGSSLALAVQVAIQCSASKGCKEHEGQPILKVGLLMSLVECSLGEYGP